MNSYAQTNVQLYNQLVESGYSEEQLILVRKGYELAVDAFTGRFEQSGKVFIAHGVGVASILASIGSEAEVITAGIVHNIYRSGEFGVWRTGVSDEKRRIVSDRLGTRVEYMLYHFARWTRKFGRENDELSYLESALEDDRNVVRIAIADQMEKLLDNEILYFHDYTERLDMLSAKVPRLVAAANRLGHPGLASEIDRRFREVSVTRVPSFLQSVGDVRFSEVRVPAFCRPRWTFQVRRSAFGAIGRLRSRVVASR
jgi:(p)ppGpp synthase/HD superfamily hydrolase